MEVAHVTCSQILAYRISEFHVDADKLHKYGAARVTAYCFCKASLAKGLYKLRFPLFLRSQ